MACGSWFQFLLVLLVTQTVVSSAVFDRILDDVKPCQDKCSETYSSKTPADIRHSECCKRGCRFFSLVEFINGPHKINSTSTKDACMASCIEAYSQTGDRYSCNVGCTYQIPFALQRQSENKNDPPSMHLLTPLMFVHNIYNNMLDRMSRIMSVSWSFYLQQDDGKVVVLQSEPEIITEYLDADDIDYDKNQDGTSLKGDDSDNRLQLEKSSAELRFRLLPDLYNYHQNQRISAPRQKDESVATYTFISNNSFAINDWLGCVARKSGLPRWFICITILFSALAMIWLCLTSAATAPDHHLKSQKLSIYGDIDYICLQEAQEKVNIQPPCEYEAAPLPVKIHLQKL